MRDEQGRMNALLPAAVIVLLACWFEIELMGCDWQPELASTLSRITQQTMNI